MATPDLIPRADNEGKVGISGTAWQSGYFYNLFRNGSPVYTQADNASEAHVDAGTANKVVTAELLKTELDALSLTAGVTSIEGLDGVLTLADLDGAGVSIDGHTHVVADIPSVTNLASASNDTFPTSLAVSNAIAGIGNPSVATLTDANIGALVDGQVLTWDDGAGEWVNADSGAGGAGVSSIDGLTGAISIAQLAQSGRLAPFSHTHIFAHIPGLQGALDDKSDDDHNHLPEALANVTGSPTNEQVMVYDGGTWVFRSLKLRELYDVNDSNIQDSYVLKWNAANNEFRFQADATGSGGVSNITITDTSTPGGTTPVRAGLNLQGTSFSLSSLHLGQASDAIFNALYVTEGVYSRTAGPGGDHPTAFKFNKDGVWCSDTNSEIYLGSLKVREAIGLLDSEKANDGHTHSIGTGVSNKLLDFEYLANPARALMKFGYRLTELQATDLLVIPSADTAHGVSRLRSTTDSAYFTNESSDLNSASYLRIKNDGNMEMVWDERGNNLTLFPGDQTAHGFQLSLQGTNPTNFVNEISSRTAGLRLDIPNGKMLTADIGGTTVFRMSGAHTRFYGGASSGGVEIEDTQLVVGESSFRTNELVVGGRFLFGAAPYGLNLSEFDESLENISDLAFGDVVNDAALINDSRTRFCVESLAKVVNNIICMFHLVQ